MLCKVYLFFYLSKIDGIMTILCFLARSLKNWTDYPYTDSENSTHGYLYLVHIKNGALKISCKQTILAP